MGCLAWLFFILLFLLVAPLLPLVACLGLIVVAIIVVAGLLYIGNSFVGK